MTTADRVITFIADQSGRTPAEVRPDSKLADLELDSVDTIELVLGSLPLPTVSQWSERLQQPSDTATMPMFPGADSEA